MAPISISQRERFSRKSRRAAKFGVFGLTRASDPCCSLNQGRSDILANRGRVASAVEYRTTLGRAQSGLPVDTGGHGRRNSGVKGWKWS